jgi:hypothetical protein
MRLLRAAKKSSSYIEFVFILPLKRPFNQTDSNSDPMQAPIPQRWLNIRSLWSNKFAMRRPLTYPAENRKLSFTGSSFKDEFLAHERDYLEPPKYREEFVYAFLSASNETDLLLPNHPEHSFKLALLDDRQDNKTPESYSGRNWAHYARNPHEGANESTVVLNVKDLYEKLISKVINQICSPNHRWR